jgi:transcriptional regulator with XRE-family HTH domain
MSSLKPESRRVLGRLNQEPSHVTWVREHRGVSKRDLAAAIGKAESLVGEIEKGTRNATPEVLLAMAEFLGCPVSMLERRVRPAYAEAVA